MFVFRVFRDGMPVSRQSVAMSRVNVVVVRMNVERLRPLDADEQHCQHDPQSHVHHAESK